MEKINPTQYTLLNVATGNTIEDHGWTLDDATCSQPSLVRAQYACKQINPKGDEHGIYRFADWLPIKRTLKGSCAPVTYKSKTLAKHLGLNNLYITFNGYFPERGANMTTCSFKETEAYTVCGRLNADEKRILVVASAGNTARAFAKVCSDNKIPLLLSVPTDNLDALWFEEKLDDCVKLISPVKGADYFDAIHLSNQVLGSPRFLAEGGAKNIARRDGMATTMLSAATHIGQIPDYYFQAVGSGTGAIAAWEANLRLIADGRFGKHKTKLMVSQNSPFTPMYDAWKVASRAMLEYDDDQARADVEVIDAKVLSNRKPPYGINGGLFDALQDSNGEIICVTNEQSREASQLFEDMERIDIHPAAAVAVASLIDSVKNKRIDPDKIIMLNITGGGEKRYKLNKELFYLKPSCTFEINSSSEDILKRVNSLFM